MGAVETAFRARWCPGPAGPSTIVVAHRGLVGPAPENSLEAIAAAIAAGVDAVEVDVRRDSSGRLILAHDPPAPGGVRPPALASAPPPAGRPAELVEVLELAAGRIGLNLEIKEPGLAAEMANLIAAGICAPPTVLVSSFLEGELEAMARLLPECPTGLVRGALGVSSRGRPGMVRQALACGATHLVVERHRAGPRLLAKAALAGLQILVWTVNQPAQLRRLLGDPRVAGVVTDQAQLALELRSQL